ncbi:MAG: dephospho-CoA kinase [Christensenellaceae bacterium]|jgi:dephospho-CoA kinase|nr:dephospho-CoA kinase [Christensenellaceae bacterium]
MLIAIAGGAGVGKSTVSEIIKKRGFEVLDVDQINRELFNDSSYQEKLIKTFPDAVCNGFINKNLLRNIIFNSEDDRYKLNAISHPIIIDHIKQLRKNDAIVFIQIPLLIQSNTAFLFDRIIAVDAPKATRLSRLLKRDNISMQDALNIIKAQEAEDAVCNIADYILSNIEFDNLNKEIDKILNDLC